MTKHLAFVPESTIRPILTVKALNVVFLFVWFILSKTYLYYFSKKSFHTKNYNCSTTFRNILYTICLWSLFYGKYTNYEIAR